MEDSGIDSDQKNIPRGISALFQDNVSDSSSVSFNGEDTQPGFQLQRKAGQKLIDRSKLHKVKKGDYKKLNAGPSLMPLERLPIPSKLTSTKEHLPLVEWDTDESEEDIHFFPVGKPNVKAELTDTFSIEEFDVSADEDDSNLLPPKGHHRRFVCCPVSLKCTII